MRLTRALARDTGRTPPAVPAEPSRQSIPGESQAVPSRPSNRLLRLPQVLDRTGLSRSMIYLLESQGRFPGRVNVGARAVAWPEDEVHRWVEAKKASRPAPMKQADAQVLSRALAGWRPPPDLTSRSETTPGVRRKMRT